MTTAQQFADRRDRVLERMGSGVMVIAAAPVAMRNNDVEHDYRQDSDLYYLTGFDEPNSVLVLSTVHEEHRMVLFVPPRDPEMETWHGVRAGVEGAVSRFGADASFSIEELAKHLPDYLEGAERVFHRIGQDELFDAKVIEAIKQLRVRRRRTGAVAPSEIIDATRIVHAMRHRKDEAELGAMARAAEITAVAHARAMEVARPGGHEYEVEAALVGTFRREGAERPAYGTIVGGGVNGTILHYTRNDAPLRDGELLLIDAGAEYDYYACDVTRTFPIGGRFTDAQRTLYDIVLAAERAGIAAVKPGATLHDVHMAALKVLVAGMIDAGLVEGPLDEAIEKERYRPFYMHKTSHWLGMDVHDVGDYFVDGEHLPLQEGMVLTVEPGIYVAVDAKAPERFVGIGIRIEDDVAVTADGCHVLTDAIPKDPDELERILQARPLAAE